MKTYYIGLNSYGINHYNSNNTELPFNENKVTLCIILHGLRPVFLKNKNYSTMNELLSFVNRYRHYISISDDNDTNILVNDFMNLVISETMNTDTLAVERLFGILNISDRLYTDDILTLWIDSK